MERQKTKLKELIKQRNIIYNIQRKFTSDLWLIYSELFALRYRVKKGETHLSWEVSLLEKIYGEKLLEEKIFYEENEYKLLLIRKKIHLLCEKIKIKK